VTEFQKCINGKWVKGQNIFQTINLAGAELLVENLDVDHSGKLAPIQLTIEICNDE